jgi:hypothetical protein
MRRVTIAFALSLCLSGMWVGILQAAEPPQRDQWYLAAGPAFQPVIPLAAEPAAGVVGISNKVLTITVDGPNASVDVFCGTTTDRVTTDHVRATPENIMDVFHQLCSPAPDWS